MPGTIRTDQPGADNRVEFGFDRDHVEDVGMPSVIQTTS